MVKIRKLLSGTAKILLFLLLLVFALALTFWKSANFQTYVTGKVAGYFSEQLGARISVGRVDFKLFNTFVLEDVYVEDEFHDTLLFAKQIFCDIENFSLDSHFIDFEDIKLRDARFRLDIAEGEDATNLQFILDYFRQPKLDTLQATWAFTAKSIALENIHFSYRNQNVRNYSKSIHWEDLDVRNFNFIADEIEWSDDTLHAVIQKLNLSEKSGFMLSELQTDYTLSGDRMRMQDLHILTPASELKTDLVFKYKEFAAFQSFISGVRMEAQFQSCKANFSDLAYFTEELHGLNQEFTLEGNVKGTVNNLRGKKLKINANDSFFRGNVSMNGLPDMAGTFLSVDVKQLETSKMDIEKFQSYPFSTGDRIKIPNRIAMLGKLQYSGNFTGFLNDFVSYGELRSALGTLKADMKFKLDSATNIYSYTGDLATTNFHIGRFYGEKMYGRVTSDFFVQGRGLRVEDLHASLKGNIEKMTINNYTFADARVEGHFQQKYFEGKASITEENIDLDFAGSMDFRAKIPQLDVESEIRHINLSVLGFTDRIDASVSTKLKLRLFGQKVADFVGLIDARELRYFENGKAYRFSHVLLDTEEKGSGTKILKINSAFLDADIVGNFTLSELPKSVMNAVSRYLPSFSSANYAVKNRQTVEFSLCVKETKSITELFLPGIALAVNTNLSGQFDSEANTIQVSGNSPWIEVMGRLAEGIDFSMVAQEDILHANVSVGTLSVNDSLAFTEILLDTKTHSDLTAMGLSWKDRDGQESGSLDGITYFTNSKQFRIEFLDSRIMLQHTLWQLDSRASVEVSGTDIEIKYLNMVSQNHRVTLSGFISKDQNKKLQVELKEFDLALLNPLIDNNEISLAGVANGSGTFSSLYSKPHFTSRVKVRNLAVNQQLIGTLEMSSLWNSTTEAMSIDGYLLENGIGTLTFDGKYFTRRTDNELDVTVMLDNRSLTFLNKFIPPDISGVTGSASGNLHITGDFTHPLVKGKLDFVDAGVKINYLNTYYKFSSQVIVEHDWMGFNYIPIFDKLGNVGHATGTIVHNNYKNWNFDVMVDVEHLLCLNTSGDMNDMFYGDVFATGSVGISGYLNNVEINVAVKTGAGTKINLPLSGSEDITMQNFVTFINTGVNNKAAVADLSGINMLFELEVTPDAEVRLIFDEKAGDVMYGRGTGYITMEIDAQEEFKMFGQYEVEEGHYLFTLENVINKKFIVEKGGTVSWYGDPYDADLDLKAIYKVKASLYDLMTTNASEHRSRVPVDVVMALKGKLLTPEITFDFRLPSTDQNTTSYVKSVINNEQEMNKQIFALLLLNRFLPPPNGIHAASERGGLGIGATSSSELLSNQLSNWLSTVSKEFDIGVNYRPGDNITNEEVAVVLSSQFLNERLTVNGNFGVSYGNESNSNPTSLVGDFKLSYNITPDGKLKLEAYNESNDFDLSNIDQAGYTQGAGVFYREEFDTGYEFKEKLKNLYRRREKKIVFDN